MEFTLPDAFPAQIELVDVGGRRVRSQAVGPMGAGTHFLDLSGGAVLPPGIYIVRLTRGPQAMFVKACVVR